MAIVQQPLMTSGFFFFFCFFFVEVNFCSTYQQNRSTWGCSKIKIRKHDKFRTKMVSAIEQMQAINTTWPASWEVSILCWLAASLQMFYENLPEFENKDKFGNNCWTTIVRDIHIQHSSGELWLGHIFWVCVHCDLGLGDVVLGQNYDTPFGHGRELCKILSRSNMTVRRWSRHVFWVCVHCDLDLRDVTSDPGHVRPFGNGQQLCEILSRLTMAVRRFSGPVFWVCV